MCMLPRGAFVAGAAAVLAAPSMAGAQVDDERPPTVDTEHPIEVASGVFVLRDHRVWLVPNIGIVLGKDAALVIDTGLGPHNGERVLRLARQLAGKRKLYLTTTHFHPEHSYGAQSFKSQATIIANRAQRDELMQKGERYVRLFRQTQGRAVAAALKGTRIVMPDAVYDGPSEQLDLGDRKVDFHCWGLAHTRGDQVINLPVERILFAGDLVENPMFPIFPWFPPTDTELDPARWISILRGFQRFRPKLVVSGHGDPGTIDVSLQIASYMQIVGDRVSHLASLGKTAGEIIRDNKPEFVALHPEWLHPMLIDWQINYFVANPNWARARQG